MSVDIPVDIVLRWEPDERNEWGRCPVHLVLRGESVATMWLPLDMAEGAALLALLKYVLGRS